MSLATPPAGPLAPPRLENGDRMDAEEFERRYAARLDIKKAELIEGVVHVASPVSHRHARPHRDFGGWLMFYNSKTPGVDGGSDGTLRLDLGNQPQPDGYLFIEETHGGRVRLDADGYVIGGPELTAEVALSTVSLDLNARAQAYLSNDVLEYLVWRVRDRAIDWFIRRVDRYEHLAPGADGITRSEVFPGLWLDAKAMTRGDLSQMLEILRQGLASPEHAEFVARLAARAAQPPA